MGGLSNCCSSIQNPACRLSTKTCLRRSSQLLLATPFFQRSALMHGDSRVETPAAVGSQSSQESSWTGTAPNDASKMNSKITAPHEELGSVVGPESESTFSEPVQAAKPGPATTDTGFSWSNAKQDELYAPHRQ